MITETQANVPDEYRQVFAKLQQQVETCRRGGLKAQSVDFIEGFSNHYLVALSTLSQMRRQGGATKKLLPQCQSLLVQANLLLYPEEAVTGREAWRYVWRTLPAQVWESRGFHLASLALVALATVVGFVIVRQNFEMAPVFMPTGLRASHELDAYLFSTDAQRNMLTGGQDMGTVEKSLFATYLMINNIKVALICFVTGFLFGIPTVLMLLQTGFMLGTLPALFWGGDLVGLGAWLLPHGVPEIAAILLAGGAGLELGWATLQPTAEPRGRLLKRTLKRIAGTVLVFVVLLIWAGLVESFVRQSHLSTASRYLIAALACIPLVLLFLRGYWVHRDSRMDSSV